MIDELDDALATPVPKCGKYWQPPHDLKIRVFGGCKPFPTEANWGLLGRSPAADVRRQI